MVEKFPEFTDEMSFEEAAKMEQVKDTDTLLKQLNLVEPIAAPKDSEVKIYGLSLVIHHAVTSALEQMNLLY